MGRSVGLQLLLSHNEPSTNVLAFRRKLPYLWISLLVSWEFSVGLLWIETGSRCNNWRTMSGNQLGLFNKEQDGNIRTEEAKVFPLFGWSPGNWSECAEVRSIYGK